MKEYALFFILISFYINKCVAEYNYVTFHQELYGSGDFRAHHIKVNDKYTIVSKILVKLKEFTNDFSSFNLHINLIKK